MFIVMESYVVRFPLSRQIITASREPVKFCMET